MKPDYNSYSDFVWNFDEYKAYLLGLVMADGCITFQNGCFKMQIGLNIKDKDILDKLHTYFKVGSINVSTDNSGFKPQTRARYTVYDHNLVHGLMYFEVEPRKTGVEVIPSLPQEYMRHFLRGFFDGDGYVHCSYNENTKRNVHQMGFALNKSMGEAINRLFKEELSISPKKIRPNGKSKENFLLTLSGAGDLKKIYKYFYEGSNIYLDRKYETFTKLYKGLIKKEGNYHGRVY